MRFSRSEKGITLIALTVTIIVLIIITSITIFNMDSSLKMKKVDKLYNDISNLKTKIDTYYIKYKEIPILETYCTSKSELISILEDNGAKDVNLDKNDDEYYYVIDLSKIEDLTLNYGKEFKENLSEDKGKKDLYIINNKSHQIYYPKTIALKDKIYYSYFSSDKEFNIGTISSIDGEMSITSKVTSMNYSILTGTKVKLVANITINDEGKENCIYQYVWSNNSENPENFKNFPNITGEVALESEKLGAGNYWLYIKRINEVGEEKTTKVKFNSEEEEILPIVINEEMITLEALNSENFGIKISYNNVQIEDLKYGIGDSLEEAKRNLKNFSKDLIDENSDENITEYNIMQEDGIDLTQYFYVQGKEKDKENITSAYINFVQNVSSSTSSINIYDALNNEFLDGKIYGKTVQETRSGKNLFDIKKYFRQYLDDDNNMIYSKSDFVDIYKTNIYINAKENTQYTISFDYEVYSSDTSQGNGISIYFYDANGENIIYDTIISKGEKKTGKFVLTSNANKTVAYINFAYLTEGRECEEVKLSNIQVEEGTISTEYEEYGSNPSLDYPIEMQSVGDLVTDETNENYGKYKIPIIVKSKNLISNTIEKYSGYYYDSLGNISGEDSRFIRVEPISVEPNTTYTLSSNLNIYTIWEFNGTTSIRKIQYNGTFTTSENCDKIRISLYNTSGIADTSALEWIQLEYGDEATEYEKYVEPTITNIYLDEPLRKIGEYKDYIDLKKGKVVRNVSYQRLNGAIGEYLTYNEGDSNVTFYKDMFYKDWYKRRLYFKSNRLKLVDSATKLKENAGFSYGDNSSRVYFSLPVTLGKTIDEVKKWLGDNLTYFIYPSEMQTEEDIVVPDIILNSGTSILKVDTTIKPSNMEFKYISIIGNN